MTNHANYLDANLSLDVSPTRLGLSASLLFSDLRFSFASPGPRPTGTAMLHMEWKGAHRNSGKGSKGKGEDFGGLPVTGYEKFTTPSARSYYPLTVVVNCLGCSADTYTSHPKRASDSTGTVRRKTFQVVVGNPSHGLSVLDTLLEANRD